jgi:hypothetical protein
MKNIFYISILICLLFFGCEKEEPMDKQVRLDFQFGSTVWTTTNGEDGVILPDHISLLRFNMYNYQNVDSAIFAAEINSSQSNNNCIVELYDVTDSTEIQGSQLHSSSTSFKYVFSNDIKDNFPTKEITLGLKLKSQNNGISVEIVRAHIFIYKK